MTKMRHAQKGVFHITTVTKGRVPWCEIEGAPDQLLRDMCVARSLYKTKIYAFCILPDHMHAIIETNALSKFMQSFKRNSSQNIRRMLYVGEWAHIGTRARVGEHGRVGSREYVFPATEPHPATGQRGQRTSITEPRVQRISATDIPSGACATLMECTGWQDGFHDVRIRDKRQFAAAKSYIETNAFHHDLVDNPMQWPWSSLYFRHLLDSHP